MDYPTSFQFSFTSNISRWIMRKYLSTFRNLNVISLFDLVYLEDIEHKENVFTFNFRMFHENFVMNSIHHMKSYHYKKQYLKRRDPVMKRTLRIACVGICGRCFEWNDMYCHVSKSKLTQIMNGMVCSRWLCPGFIRLPWKSVDNTK